MRLKLINKKEETPDVVSFIFESEIPVNWKAGQFMRYHIEDPKSDDRTDDRYFTIASSPFEKNLILTTRFVPDDGSTFKKDLQRLKIGDYIEAHEPAGTFVIKDPDQEYVFIAGGIGITPFRSILLDLDHDNLPINVTLIYANRDQNIVFKDIFDQLAQKHPSLKVHYIIDPQRIDETTIQSLISNIQLPTYYVSGPKPMVEAMEKMLAGIGVPEDHIKHDYFPGYEGI